MSHNVFTNENSFTNAEAQDFAFELVSRGIETLHETLASEPRRGAGLARRTLAACELVAAGNGHPPASSGWCAMLESWLAENNYVPTDDTLKLATERLSQIASLAKQDSALAALRDDIANLLPRLQKPHRKVHWKPFKGDRPAFRALAKWLESSQGEETNGPLFDRSGNARVVLTYLTVNASCKLINYPKVYRLELWLSNQNDRSALAASVKILLRGWRTTLQSLEFDHVADLTIHETPPPYRTLVECQAQLADLPVLQQFSTSNMFFDDNALEHVCQNPAIRELTISNAQISKNAIKILGGCKSLEEIYISRCPELKPADAAKLQKLLPHASAISIHER